MIAFTPPDPDRWRDPEFLADLARGNGVYDSWAGYEPNPPSGYEDDYWRGYDEMETE